MKPMAFHGFASFFGSKTQPQASGRVLLCVCISPEKRYAQETLCSMAFAARASRAALGAEGTEAQRGAALDAVRELHALLRMALRDRLPAAAAAPGQRLPDWLAAEVVAYMPQHGGATFVCRKWAEICLTLGRCMKRWWFLGLSYYSGLLEVKLYSLKVRMLCYTVYSAY